MKSEAGILLLPSTDFQTLNAKAIEIFNLIDASEATRLEYTSRIGEFFLFINENGIHADTFLSFKRVLEKRTDIKLSTKSKYLTTAKIFLRELFKRGLLPADITLNVKSFTNTQRHKRLGISEEEMTIIIESLNKMPINLESTRLKALIALLGFQGLREIEIKRLTAPSLDLNNAFATIQGKGKLDTEMIHLHPITVSALKAYLDQHKLKDGSLILSYSFKNTYSGISTRGIRYVVSNFLKQLGIEKTVHGFRHYFVTTIIKKFPNLLVVADFSRHKSLNMLRVYNDEIDMGKQLPNYHSTFSHHTLKL